MRASGLVGLVGQVGLVVAALVCVAAPAYADGASWREGALHEDFTVQQWAPKSCGPAPVSKVVSV